MLLLYGGINFYIYRRILIGAALTGGWNWALKIVLITLMSSYLLGRNLVSIKWLGTPLIWLGSIWFAIMTYAFILCLLVDIAKGFDLLTGWFPNLISSNLIRAGRITLIMGTILIVCLTILGNIASHNVMVRKVDLVLNKLPAEHKNYKITYFADVHLGSLVGINHLQKIVEKVNSTEPDLILIGGDIIDEPAGRLRWADEPLKQLKAPDGVWAVLGNHEFYDGLDASLVFMQDVGIKVLRNEAKIIPGKLSIAGLDDASATRQFRGVIKPVKQIIKEADPNLPIVLLHHTPLRYREAAKAGVDLMLSAHTHGGQLWPFDYITYLVYGVKRGLCQIDGMNFYLTTGAGTWGPPVRIGASPEIVVFTLNPPSVK